MKKAYRLRAAKDLKALFRYGTRTQSPFFQLVWRRNTLSHSRFAFVAPKAAVKLSVRRNRLIRMAGEWIRKRDDITSRPLDAAILFRKGAQDASDKEMYEELDRAFKRIGRPNG